MSTVDICRAASSSCHRAVCLYGLQLAQRKVECQVGVFVRVHGHLRAFSGEKNIVTFNIRPVTDFNEASPRAADWLTCCGQSSCRKDVVDPVPVPCRKLTPTAKGDACFAIVQVTYHGLQVIFQHLHITKGNAFPPADATKAEAPSPMQVCRLLL